MSKIRTILYASSALGLMASAVPVRAEGTAAGTTITNTVTVDYEANGVAQTQQSASDSFTVDRRINVTVARLDTVATSVTPGEMQAVTTFTVTNLSNDAADFDLSVAQSATDDFDLANVRIYQDNDTTPGTFDGSDTEITYLDEIGADATVTVFVVGMCRFLPRTDRQPTSS